MTTTGVASSAYFAQMTNWHILQSHSPVLTRWLVQQIRIHEAPGLPRLQSTHSTHYTVDALMLSVNTGSWFGKHVPTDNSDVQYF